MRLCWWIKCTWVRRLFQGNASIEDVRTLQWKVKNSELRLLWRQRRVFLSPHNQQKNEKATVPTLRALRLASRNEYSSRVRFSKIFFYLILIQVQGNKRTRIYLTGHGDETVKVYFLDPLFSRTRTCKWIQKVVLQKRSRMYYTVEMALDRGVTSPSPHRPQSCTELTRRRSLFVLFVLIFLILFYSKKGNNTEATKNQQYWEMSRKRRESQSSSIRPREDASPCCLHRQTGSFVSFFSFLLLLVVSKLAPSLPFWHEGSSAVNMQDKEWLTQLPTRLITSSWTPLPSPNPTVACPSRTLDSKLYMELK